MSRASSAKSGAFAPSAALPRSGASKRSRAAASPNALVAPAAAGLRGAQLQQPAHDRANDAVGQKSDQNDKDKAENELPQIADGGHLLQHVAQRQPDRGADGRADQRAGAADHGLNDELARGVQREGVGRHVALENTEQRAAAAGEDGGQHEDGKLVGADVVAERRGALADFAGSR